MLSLSLARGWYALVGFAVLVLTGVHLYEAARGARFDGQIVVIGVAVGLLNLAAAAWVTSPGRLRAAIAWVGIGAGAAAFLYALYLAVTTAGTDAVLFVGVPTLLALLAALRMAVARAGGRRSAGTT